MAELMSAEDTANDIVSSLSGRIPADAQAAIEEANNKAEQISAELQKNMDIGNQRADAMAKAIETRVSSEQTSALQNDTAQLKAENEINSVYQASGGLQAELDRAKEFRARELELERLLQEREDIMATDITGVGVIDSIINQFRAVGVEADIQAESAAYQQNLADVQNATAITQATQQRTEATKRTINQAVIAANQEKIAAAGQVELYNATLAQNQSNAATLRTMMSLSKEQMNTVMQGYALADSIENREFQREKFLFQQAEAAKGDELLAINTRRGRLAEQRDQLNLQILEGTADATVRSKLAAVDQQLVDLDRSKIALTKDAATLEAEVATAKTNAETAAVNLERAQLALDEAEDMSPEKRALLSEQLESAKIANERAQYEFNEARETEATRRGRAEGALEAQEIQNRISALTLEERGATSEARTAATLATQRELTRQQRADEEARVAQVESVHSAWSFLYGDSNLPKPGDIESRIDANDPVFIAFAQMGRVRGPNNEFILGVTPAKAKERIDLIEATAGPITSDIKGVKVIREVTARIAKMHQENPASIPQDDAAAAIQFNDEARKYMEEMGEEITFGDATNILQPPSIPEIIELADKQDTGFADTKLAKLLQRDGQRDTNTDQILEKGIVALNAGDTTLNELVSDITMLGNSIGVYNNTNTHGFKTVGLDYQKAVNMRVLKPRGFIMTMLNTAYTAGAGLVNYAASGAAANLSGSAFMAAGLPTPGIITKLAGSKFARQAASESESDWTTLNIADPVAVRQHIISIQSSTTLGGNSTPTTLKEEE